MAANCLYYINGQWVTEANFKELLYSGLLDQLIVAENIEISEFPVDQQLGNIGKQRQKTKPDGISVRILRKINRKFNNSRQVEDGQVLDNVYARNNPNEVIKAANAAIEEQQKKTGMKRTKVPFVVVIKGPDGLKYGKADEKTIKYIKTLESGSQNPIAKMELWKPYLLIPSGTGVRAVPLRNSFLGETKIAKQIENQLKLLFTLEGDAFTKAKKKLEKNMYKVSFEKEGNTIIVRTAQADGTIKEEIANRPEELNTIILGTYKDGKYIGERNQEGKMSTPGKLARINYFEINKKGQNEKYADDGFFTTDLYQENGNFFNSSGFVLDTKDFSKYTPEILESIKKQISKAKEEEASKKAAINEMAKKEVEDQKNKKGESRAFASPIDELAIIISREVSIPNTNKKAKVYAVIEGNQIEVYKIEAYTQARKPQSNIIENTPAEISNEEKNSARNEFFKISDVAEFKTITKKQNEDKKVAPLKTQGPIDEEVGDFALLTELPDIDLPELGGTASKSADLVAEATGQVLNTEDLGGEADDVDFSANDDNPKARTTTIGEHWDKEKELQWIQDKLGKAVRDKITMFESEEELREYLSPKGFEYLRNLAKQPGSLQGLFTKAGLYLKNNAFAGTAYHEAFHVVFNLALSKEERILILKEAKELFKSELSENPTYLEVEELLADKFMEYVQSDGTLDFKKQEGPKTFGQRVTDFFKNIFRLIKTLFNNKATISIESLFSDIQFGKYKDTITFKNTDTSEFESMRASSISKVYSSFTDIRLEKEAIEYIKQTFFAEINSIKEADLLKSLEEQSFAGLNDPDIISKVGPRVLLGKTITRIVKTYGKNKLKPNSELFKQLASELGVIFREGGQISFSPEVFETVKGPDGTYLIPVDLESMPLMQAFLRTLKSEDGIIIKDLSSAVGLVEDRTEPQETDEDNENKLGDLENWQRDIAEFDPRTTMSQTLKRIFNNFYKVNPKNGNPLLNRFGARETFAGNEVFSFLSQRITNSTSVEDMFEKLEAIKNERDFIPQLLDKLQSNYGLVVDLYVTLASKSNINYMTVYYEKGHYRIFNKNRKTIGKIIEDFLIANFLNHKSKFFNNHTSGPLSGQKDFTSIDKEFALQKLAEFKEIRTNFDNARGKDTIITELGKISEFLYSIELPITTKQLVDTWAPVRTDVSPSVKRVHKVLNRVEDILQKLSEGQNPFLEIKKSDSGENQTAIGSPVAGLAAALKLGLETHVNMAFRDSNNKTKYTVQYSNYLNKLFSKLTNPREAKAFWEEIRQDPILSKSPMINDIFDMETGELKTFSTSEEGLTVAMFESLSRQGKFYSIPYDELSPAELEAVCLAFFQNNAKEERLKEEGFSFYKLPIPSNSTNIPFVKARRYTNEQIIDNLVELALGEIARINKLKNIPDNHKLNFIPNYVENGTKFVNLSFLNSSKYSLEELQTEEGLLRSEIESYIFNTYLANEYQKAEEKGILYYDKGALRFEEELISNAIKDKKQFYDNYLLNTFYTNIELNTILAGDPAFYKNTEDFQKRFKQVISPGSYTDTKVVNDYNILILEDEIVPTEEETVKAISELIMSDKNLNPQKKAALLSIWKDLGTKERGNNNSDGATYISIERYLDILDSMNRTTQAHRDAAVRIREGVESIDDIALFPPIKPFMFTKINIDGTIVPVQVKNSEVLLTRAMAERKDVNGNLKYPKLAKAYEILENGITHKDGSEHEVNAIVFESAIKVGGLFSGLNESGEPIKNNLTKDASGNYILNEEAEVITLKQEDWKLQNETPPHYVDEIGNYGSQIRNLIIADLDFDAIYEDGNGKKITGRELAQEYQDLIVANIKESAEGVRKIFKDKDGNFSLEKLVEFLRREIEDRNMDPGYLEALELIPHYLNPNKTTTALPLWHPSLNIKVQNLMYSFVNNRIIKQKINGGNMINTTGFGISDDLKIEVDSKTGAITYQALLPWWSKKFFPQLPNGEVDLSVLPEQLLEIIGYRIPTEDKYSMFNIRVKGFTDPAQGGTLILPPEAVTIAGLDFDIDKLFMMIPNFYVVEKDGKKQAVYIKPLSANSSKKEIVDHIFRDLRGLEKFLTTYLPEGVSTKNVTLSVEEILQNRINLFDYRKQAFEEKSEQKLLQLEIENLSAQIEKAKSNKQKEALQELLYEKVTELETFIPYNESIARANQLINTIKDAIVESLEGVSVKASDIQGKKSRDNRLMEIVKSILKNRNTAVSILDPGGFAEEKALGSKLRLLKISDKKGPKAELKKEALALFSDYSTGKITINDYQDALKKLIDRLEDIDFNINYPSTQRELFVRNMTGNDLIGIFANHNVHHAKAQLSQLKLRTPIYINGVEYQDLNKIYSDTKSGKIRISKSLANLIAAVVDNAKDPIASYLNMNTYTADIIATMLRLGVESEYTFTFINQPIILEVTNAYFKAKGSLKESNASFARIKKDLKAKIQKSFNISEEEFNTIDENIVDISLEELQDSLVKGTEAKYFLDQYKVLSLFEEILNISGKLGEVTRATKTDTSGPGPTHGAAFSKMYKQSKILNNPEYPILGVKDFLIEKEEGVHINAAFTQYGWREFIDIMNEIFPAIGRLKSDNTIKLSQLGRLKVRFSNMKDSIYSISEKEANSIDAGMISFLASGFPTFKYNQAESVLKDTPDNLRDFIANNPDSPFIPFLEQLNIESANNKIPIKRISFYTTGKNAQDIINYKRLWYEMLISPDPAVHKLAMDLVKYTFFSSGFNFGPYTFFHLVPEIMFTDKFARNYPHLELTDPSRGNRSFNQHIEAGLAAIEGGDTTLLERFEKQFVQNTGEKSLMIPNISTTESILFSPQVKDFGNMDVQIVLDGPNVGKITPLGKANQYGVRKAETLEGYINELQKLMDVARQNPKKLFHVSKSLHYVRFEDDKFNQAFLAIHNTTGIPDNVRFAGEKEDVRGWRKHQTSEGILKLNKATFRNIQVQDADGIFNFPKFIKTSNKSGKVELYQKVEEGERHVLYTKINLLGTSLFAVEYNMFNDITESVTLKLKNSTSTPVLGMNNEEFTAIEGSLNSLNNLPDIDIPEISDPFAHLPDIDVPGTSDPFAYLPDIDIPNIKIIKALSEEDPGEAPVITPELREGILPIAEIIKDPSYEKYVILNQAKGETIKVSKEVFESMPLGARIETLKHLNNC